MHLQETGRRMKMEREEGGVRKEWRRRQPIKKKGGTRSNDGREGRYFHMVGGGELIKSDGPRDRVCRH